MKKVLFVCGQEFILDRKDGGKKCAYRNYCMLKTVYGEENVYAYIFTNEYKEKDEYVCREQSHRSLLRKILHVFLLRPFCSLSSEQRLISYIYSNHFDLIFFERSMFGPITKKLKSLNIKTQIFCENIEKNYLWRKVKSQNVAFLFPYISTKLNEKMTFKYADSVICLTKRDSLLLKKFYGKTCDAVIPMTFSDSLQEDRIIKTYTENEKKLLFIGSCFYPNYEGIKWFIINVMDKLPEYTLLVVGKNFEKKRNELQTANVQIVGTVDDLSEFYLKNYAMVMPILSGDGMKIKTAEAMMYGKTILASDEALEGYDVEGVKGIYRCNTPEEYITSIQKVYAQNNIGYIEDVRKLFLEKYVDSNAVKIYQKYFGD